ncbi:MAG: hypothetical protein WCO55_06280 [Candidatus Falkowbacteria bacterium]
MREFFYVITLKYYCGMKHLNYERTSFGVHYMPDDGEAGVILPELVFRQIYIEQVKEFSQSCHITFGTKNMPVVLYYNLRPNEPLAQNEFVYLLTLRVHSQSPKANYEQTATGFLQRKESELLMPETAFKRIYKEQSLRLSQDCNFDLGGANMPSVLCYHLMPNEPL